MTFSLRRVVTGHDSEGRALAVIDETVQNITRRVRAVERASYGAPRASQSTTMTPAMARPALFLPASRMAPYSESSNTRQA
jgi:hypothetical protein